MSLTKKDIINLIVEANRKFYEEFPNEQITEVNEEEEIVMNELYGNVADEIFKTTLTKTKMNKGKVLDTDKLRESEVECNIISDEVKVEYLRHRVKWLETDNAALCKELTELKLKLKDLI